MPDTRLGEIARKLVPLLVEFKLEAHRVTDDDAKRDALILQDYMMHKYPRIVVFLACIDMLSALAQQAPE